MGIVIKTSPANYRTVLYANLDYGDTFRVIPHGKDIIKTNRGPAYLGSGLIYEELNPEKEVIPTSIEANVKMISPDPW